MFSEPCDILSERGDNKKMKLKEGSINLQTEATDRDQSLSVNGSVVHFTPHTEHTLFTLKVQIVPAENIDLQWPKRST